MFQIKSRIFRRLLIALVLIAVIPACIMGYQAYRAAQEALTGTAFMHMATIAADHANHLERWFKERSDDIRVLSELPTVRDLCEHYCSIRDYQIPSPEHARLLTSIVALTQGRSPSYENIHIINLSGEIIASTNPDSEILSEFENLPVFERWKQSKEPVLSSVHRHKQGLRLLMLARVQVPGRQPIALVLAVLDVSKTLDPIMTDRIGLGETGETYLVDKSGRIISESRYLDHEKTFSRSFESLGIRRAQAHESGTAIYENYMGREVVGSYLWLPRFGWGLIAEMGRGEIMEPLVGIKTIVILTALIVSFLCLMFALRVTQRVSQPIIRMSEAAREMAEGRLNQRIPYSGDDEIGTLATSFNTMTQKLSSLIDSLRKKEESLQSAYNELIATQQQLVHSEKMAAIGQLVAGVVHEMRTPLSSIKLNLQIIRRSIKKEEALSEHYEIALDQAMQLEKMLSDLLNYSKPLSLQRVETDLGNLVEKSLMQLRNELLVQEIRVEKEFRPDVPFIQSDPDKIVQVLVNVIKNGIEATGRGGTVKITTDLNESNGRTFVDLAISDNGPGIPPQHQARVFQPFFTTKKKGTGLGLSIVNKIMEAHEGMISIESESGEGTTVQLRFPTE